MFKDIIDKTYERYKTDEVMHDVIDMVSRTIEKMREEFPKTYKELICELEEYLYDIPLEEAKKIVSKMSNEYGMSGERWTYEQICEVASQHQIPESISRCDLYIVMNMWNIDYVSTMKKLKLEDNVDAYLSFSCDWLTDSDFGKGKVYKYFIKIHEDDKEEDE